MRGRHLTRNSLSPRANFPRISRCFEPRAGKKITKRDSPIDRSDTSKVIFSRISARAGAAKIRYPIDVVTSIGKSRTRLRDTKTKLRMPIFQRDSINGIKLNKIFHLGIENNQLNYKQKSRHTFHTFRRMYVYYTTFLQMSYFQCYFF